MENAQNLNGFFLHAVNDHKRKTADGDFPRTGLTADAAPVWHFF
jgi:hypothetical protein